MIRHCCQNSKRFCIYLFLLITAIPCFSLDTDSIPKTTPTLADTLNAVPVSKDTLLQGTINSKSGVDSLKPTTSATTNSLTTTENVSNDSLYVKDGFYVGVGIGWSIGSFGIMQLWEGALLDSLSHFGLSINSYKSDTTSDELNYMDTVGIKYVTKELPGQYNIIFPLSLSLNKITPDRKYGLSLSFAYTGKTQKSVVIGVVDTLSESVNIKQHLRIYGLALVANYAFFVPDQYFTIVGVDRSFISFGFGLAPQVIQLRNSTEYKGTNNRMMSIRSSVSNALKNKTTYGAGITLKTGFSTFRQISKLSTVEFDLFYSLTRYDYFYSDGNRLVKSWINPAVKDSEKWLSFLSNRLELSISLLRHRFAKSKS